MCYQYNATHTKGEDSLLPCIRQALNGIGTMEIQKAQLKGKHAVRF